MFRHYCRPGLLKGFAKLVLTGTMVLAVFALAFGPIWYYGQLDSKCRGHAFNDIHHSSLGNISVSSKGTEKSSTKEVSRWASYAYTCGFMFGWHVLEKASLHFVIPLASAPLRSTEDAKKHYTKKKNSPLVSNEYQSLLWMEHSSIHILQL